MQTGFKPPTGKCRGDFKSVPERNARWEATRWSTYNPTLFADNGDFAIEVDAPERPVVMDSPAYGVPYPIFLDGSSDARYIRQGRSAPLDQLGVMVPSDESFSCSGIVPKTRHVCHLAAVCYDPKTDLEFLVARSTDSEMCGAGSETACGTEYSPWPSFANDTGYRAWAISVRDAPIFGDPAGAVYASSVEQVFDSQGNPLQRLRCTYSRDALARSCSAAGDWNDMLSSLSKTLPTGSDHVSYDTEMMKTLCDTTWVNPKGQETVNWLECPSCQSWANSLEYADGTTNATRCTRDKDSKITSGDCPARYSDLQMEKWCQTRSGNPACKCVLRAQQPDWQKFASLSASNAGCWYRPCAGGMTPGGYLVEYDARNAQVTGCPDICQSVINVLDSGGATLDDVTQTTICGGGGEVTPVWQKWLLYGLAGLVGAALLAGGSYALYKFANKNAAKK